MIGLVHEILMNVLRHIEIIKKGKATFHYAVEVIDFIVKS